MIREMLWTLYHIMLQSSQRDLKNPAALDKIFKEFPTINGKLCDKEFRDAIVRYRIKFLNIASYIFYLNQMVFKFSFKNWGLSYCFCIFIYKAIPEACSTWRCCKLGNVKIYLRFNEVVFAMFSSASGVVLLF